MDVLNQFMKKNKVNFDLQVRVKKYIKFISS